MATARHRQVPILDSSLSLMRDTLQEARAATTRPSARSRLPPSPSALSSGPSRRPEATPSRRRRCVQAGVGDRCGFDVALAATASQRAQAGPLSSLCSARPLHTPPRLTPPRLRPGARGRLLLLALPRGASDAPQAGGAGPPALLLHARVREQQDWGDGAAGGDRDCARQVKVSGGSGACESGRSVRYVAPP